MAAGDSARAHPPTLHPAVALNRLVRVVRARGVVAAGRGQDAGKGQLVTADQQKKYLRHQVNLASLSAASEASALSSSNDISSAPRRAIRTTSYRIPTWRKGESGPSNPPLATSRRRRRARLRSTEVLIPLVTVTPMRLSA